MDPWEKEHRPKIRVLLADVTEVVNEVVGRLIGDQHDMTLLGTVRGRVALLQTVDAETDVVVLGAPHGQPPPGVCSHLLSEYPFLRILVLADRGTDADLYWLGLRSRHVGEVSPASLLACIREASRLNPAV